MKPAELFTANDLLREEIAKAEAAGDFTKARMLFLRRLEIGRKINDLPDDPLTPLPHPPTVPTV